MEKEIFIADAVRTPIGDFGGSLKALSATELAMAVIDAALCEL